MASSSKLLKELPEDAVMDGIISNLRLQSDRSIAILGAAYLDHSLELLLKITFRDLSNEDEKRMFDANRNGLMATFVPKIRMSYALGLIADRPYELLKRIAEIRNAFAHSLHDIDFTNPLVAEDCRHLAVFAKETDLKLYGRDDVGAAETFCSVTRTLYFSIRRRAEEKALEIVRSANRPED